MDEIIYGRNPVLEALASDANLQRIYILKDNQKNKDILAEAKKRGLPVDYHDRTSLARISGTENHQGVVAQMAPLAYADLEDILSVAKDKGEAPLILICDHLEDPHNLGAIIRSAVCFGAHGIVLPKKRSVSVNSTVLKASAGSAVHIKVARVSNLAQTMDKLKEEGLWIVGTDSDGESLIGNPVLKGALAIVVGSEGKGMSTLTRKKCDLVVKIPIESTINSLNASVAAGIVLYETSKMRS